MEARFSVSEKPERMIALDLEEARFTLRAPQFVFAQIDAARRTRIGFVSRNTWILEAITEKLQRELLGRAP